MFGEYALYCDGKTVALICDDQLFIKPTVSGHAYIGAVAEGFPYPGAKPWFECEQCTSRGSYNPVLSCDSCRKRHNQTGMSLLTKPLKSGT